MRPSPALVRLMGKRIAREINIRDLKVAVFIHKSQHCPHSYATSMSQYSAIYRIKEAIKQKRLQDIVT